MTPPSPLATASVAAARARAAVRVRGPRPTDRVSASAPIALEASSLLTPFPSGVGVFGGTLAEKLAERRPDGAVHLLYRLDRRPLLRRHLPPGMPAAGYLSGHLLHRRYPLLHALDTRLPSGYRGKVVATVFDVLSAMPISGELGLAGPRFRAKKLAQYRRIATRADAVVFVSEETRRRFHEAFRFSGPESVVHPGVAPVFRPGAAAGDRLERLGLAASPYVLFVGELCTRKNLAAAASAFLRVRDAMPGLRLVLVGRPSFGWRGSGAERARQAHPRDVLTLGFLPIGDLAAVYAGATAFIYLSHYEGFGLPVLEAMASGAPVLAANRGGIPEAAGDAAILVDPDDGPRVEAALRGILESPEKREGLRRRGLARAARFTWEGAAERVEAVYRTLLDGT